MRPTHIEVGQRFGELTATGEVERTDKGKLWVCRCDCGKLKSASSTDLMSGRVKTCCTHSTKLAVETARALLQGKRKNPVGLGAGTKLYRAWRSMKSRCLNPLDKAYPGYGGKGVKVCEEWMEFIPFRVWATSHGFAGHLSIDRIDPFGDYTPSNCRWITMREQARNKRRPTFLVEAFGEVKPVSDWALDPRCAVKENSLRSRVKAGWVPEYALTRPTVFRGQR